MAMRRRFLVLFLFVILGPLFAQGTADLILYNGKIITVDSEDRICEAMAIKDGRVLAVGGSTEIAGFAGPYCKKINLHGKTVTPGLIDSHYHMMYYGAQFWPGYLNIRMPVVKSKADLLRVVTETVAELDSGEWVSANQGFIMQSDETLTRWDLDAVAPKNPCYLRHCSGQYSVVNSLALAIAGIDSSTPNPPSSLIGHDENGQPNGILSHYGAENLVGQYATGYGDRSDADKLNDIQVGQDLCLQAGYTSVQDVIVGQVKDLLLYKQFAEEGKLKVRVYALLLIDTEQEADSLIARLQPIEYGRFKFGGWKLAMDGGLAAKTVLFYDKTLYASEISYPYHDQATLNRIVRKLHDTGLQIATHVGGDEGIDMTITAYEEAMKANPRPDPRFRIEHGLFPTSQAIQRMSASHIILSTQPQWIPWYGKAYTEMTSSAAMENLLPFKTMLNMGIQLAFGCDVPASPYQEPQWAFRGAVIRRTAEGTPLTQSEKLTPQEALRIHTMGSAYASFSENVTGSLEPGKYADLVIWSHDLYTMEPTQLGDLHPQLTMVEGEILHDTGENPLSYAKGTWTASGDLLNARQFHTATLLQDGRVLIVGYAGNSAELYDPVAGSCSETGMTLASHSWGSTATLLQDGRVLVVGGRGAERVAELYDPSTGAFNSTDSTEVPHCFHTATRLNDGRVLIAGGQDDANSQTHRVVEIYDPQSGLFSMADSLLEDRSSHQSVLLVNDKVFLCGGQQSTTPGNAIALRSCEIYDPSTDQFSSAGDMNSATTSHRTILLPSGKVLISGGLFKTRTDELYDWQTGQFSPTGTMPVSRRFDHSVTLLNNGHVLLAGGRADSVLQICEIYDPDNNYYYPAEDLITPRTAHAATSLLDGTILVTGGYDGHQTLKSVERLTALPVDVVAVDHDAENLVENPEDYYLSPNFPNPFNPTTVMQYEVKNSAQVNIAVYNLLGERIKVLWDDVRAGGVYRIEWNGTDAQGRPLSSGIYIVRMEANRHTATRKILLLR